MTVRPAIPALLAAHPNLRRAPRALLSPGPRALPGAWRLTGSRPCG
ncbi:hypothetical protein [Streptomyces iconiensis]|uniref:Uncharacterized protein n=1 Tax=Streptomyces iconiensis TaxID=1384038 RepID=A0ABT6ZNX6_9ACTN|nr:hypothetical protein [Streptomyces iconiensis]MDJ1130765.1 hypothetical protein [Streptomyces iconiensis]